MTSSILRAPHLGTIAFTATVVGGAVAAASYIWLKRKAATSNFVPVARLVNITIYPIKSLAGIEVPYADCTVAGPVYKGLKDRQMLLVKDDYFVSMREEPRLGMIRVVFDEDKLTLTLTMDGYPPLLVHLHDSEEQSVPSFTVRVRKNSYKAVEVSEEASQWFKNFLNCDSIRLVRIVLDKETIDRGRDGTASDRTMSNRQVKHRVMSIKEKLDIINDIQRGAKKSVLAREKGLPLSTVCGIWAAREKVLNGAPSNLKRCRLRGSSYPDVEEALFVVPAVSAQEINPSEVDADEEAADDSDCEALLAEVLDRQGGGDRVPFSAFCDVDNDVETCEDLTDSDIVNSLSTKLCSASDGEDDDNAELEDVPCPSVAFQDKSSFQVLSKASLHELLSRLPPGSDIRQRNFRPSLFVEGCEAHSEDHWVRYRIGEAEMAFLERTRRCVMTTVDQDTGIKTGKEPLVTLRKYRVDRSKLGLERYEFQPLLGIGSIHIKDGRIAPGDEICAIISPKPLL
ncbi:hypothetical protein HPB49_012345 [Dermacentor silvarum]|uniref:Uncharacterized protein n=1 Tax=Dermacentor silvarum TaxID=543639 RepID=A0ACB8DZZ2_DERSI|nr:hypothetical protein HPB49_012345 [Dermacentor silvarum]